MTPSTLTFEHQKQWTISLSGISGVRSNRRHRCKPIRQSRPRALLASCSLFGQSFAARAASSESGKAFFPLFMRPCSQAPVQSSTFSLYLFQPIKLKSKLKLELRTENSHTNDPQHDYPMSSRLM